MWGCLILWSYQKDGSITASFSFPGHWRQGETMHSQNSGSIHQDLPDDQDRFQEDGASLFIHEYYEPEELVVKTAIAIVNLPPRKMMGIDSEGMLISAVHEEEGHEGLNLLMVDDRTPAGAKFY